MTKEELFKKFSLKEWQLLCSKSEFLEVLAAEPLNPELVKAVVHRILYLDSRKITRRPATGDVLED